MEELSGVRQMTVGLGWIDLTILGVSFAFLFVIAYFTGRKESGTDDFFLGNRRIPAIIACLSFVATEVSAVTVVGVPAVGYSKDWQYLQFFIGSAGARIFIAFLFIPVFFKFNCTTIYEFLRHRFGASTQYAGSGFFFITRLIGSGVRLYAACMAVSIIMGWTLGSTLILFTIVSIVIIAFGGIKAVVWNGAYEALIFYFAGIAVVIYILSQIQGGIVPALSEACEAGKFSIFNFSFKMNDPTTFWAGTANAFFIGLAVFGTDQELMQRLLTVDTRRSSQKAILSTIVAALPLTVLYLAVGTLLFIFYRQHPTLALPQKTDEILSHFVINSLPMGLKGLILSAVVLASIDSPLSSLSASFVTDIYRPLINKGASERHYLWVSRIGVIGFGIILAMLAYACRDLKGNVLWFAFQIVSVTGGSTLGVFLLGILTKRRSNRGNVAAMVISAFLMTMMLLLYSKPDFVVRIIAAVPWNWLTTVLKTLGEIAWTWLIVIGTVVTFGLGYLLGPVMDKAEVIPSADGSDTFNKISPVTVKR